MNGFLLAFLAVSAASAWAVTRAGWLRMLALVPVAALVPAYFGGASVCGADFLLHLSAAGRCAASDTPAEVVSAFYLAGIAAVLVLAVVLKVLRERMAT